MSTPCSPEKMIQKSRGDVSCRHSSLISPTESHRAFPNCMNIGLEMGGKRNMASRPAIDMKFGSHWARCLITDYGVRCAAQANTFCGQRSLTASKDRRKNFATQQRSKTRSGRFNSTPICSCLGTSGTWISTRCPAATAASTATTTFLRVLSTIAVSTYTQWSDGSPQR